MLHKGIITPKAVVTLRDGTWLEYKTFIIVGIRDVDATHFTTDLMLYIEHPTHNRLTVLQNLTIKGAYDLSRRMVKECLKEESDAKRTTKRTDPKSG
jgi:hypothetical protein